MTTSSPLRVSSPIAVARAVAFVIGADRRASPEERAAYDGLLARLGLDTGGAQMAELFLTDRPSVEDVAKGLVTEEDKRIALEEALAAAHADDRFSAVEMEMIERLASALGIEPAVLEVLETSAIARTGVATRPAG